MFFNAFLTHLRDLFPNRAWSLSSALDAFSCKQSLIFACRLNCPAKLHAATACRFLCAFRTPLQKLCRRVRRLRSRLPLASNFSLFTCRQQLYGLFCHRSLSVAVLFVLVFSTCRYRGFSFNTSSLWLYRSVFDDKHRERRVVRPIIKIEFQNLIFRRIERFQIRQKRVSFFVARVTAVINAHAH